MYKAISWRHALRRISKLPYVTLLFFIFCLDGCLWWTSCVSAFIILYMRAWALQMRLLISWQSMVYFIVECYPVWAVMCNISVNATTWSHDFINYSPSDINRRINKYYQGTIDQQTHTLAQLIFELVMVRDGEWSLSDNNFTKDDISAAIEHLCTVWCPAIVLVKVCVDV